MFDERPGKECLVRQRLDAIPTLNQKDSSGLRVDIALEDQSTGEVRWIDVTGVHTTSPSYIAEELKMVVRRRFAVFVANQKRVPEPPVIDPSPTILKKELAKNEKYQRLILIAKKQFSERKRSVAPVFMPFVVSDCGEVGPVGNMLQEWLVACYSRKLAATQSWDGVKPKDKIRDFRRRFRLLIQFAMAAGLGGMINAAGKAKGCY